MLKLWFKASSGTDKKFTLSALKGGPTVFKWSTVMKCQHIYCNPWYICFFFYIKAILLICMHERRPPSEMNNFRLGWIRYGLAWSANKKQQFHLKYNI